MHCSKGHTRDSLMHTTHVAQMNLTTPRARLLARTKDEVTAAAAAVRTIAGGYDSYVPSHNPHTNTISLSLFRSSLSTGIWQHLEAEYESKKKLRRSMV